MTTPTIVVFPGASLMALTPTADGGLRVRCPGCGARQVYKPPVTGELAFVHEAGCPIHQQIQDAIARYKKETVVHG